MGQGFALVSFVVYHHPGNVPRAQLANHLVHGFRLDFPFRVGDIDHVQQDIRKLQFFQRRLER